jgi:phenylalanyl-tRNA synthetase alpha chain
MTDLCQARIPKSSGQIAAAGDEAALEAVRVAALGKKGTISALLATLGKDVAGGTQDQRAAINLAKDKSAWR